MVSSDFSPKGIYFVFLVLSQVLSERHIKGSPMNSQDFPGRRWPLSCAVIPEPVTMRPGQELRFPASHLKSIYLVHSHPNKTVATTTKGSGL